MSQSSATGRAGKVLSRGMNDEIAPQIFRRCFRRRAGDNHVIDGRFGWVSPTANSPQATRACRTPSSALCGWSPGSAPLPGDLRQASMISPRIRMFWFSIFAAIWAPSDVKRGFLPKPSRQGACRGHSMCSMENFARQGKRIAKATCATLMPGWKHHTQIGHARNRATPSRAPQVSPRGRPHPLFLWYSWTRE